MIKKYHVFKYNPINGCCNPSSYRLFEDFEHGTTKFTDKLKYGNKFRTIAIGWCKTGSCEHELLKKYGYTIIK